MKKFLGMMITFECLFFIDVTISMVDVPIGKSCMPLKREEKRRKCICTFFEENQN